MSTFSLIFNQIKNTYSLFFSPKRGYMIGVPKPYPSTKKFDFFVCFHLNLMIFLNVNITLQGINNWKNKYPYPRIYQKYIYTHITLVATHPYGGKCVCNPFLWRSLMRNQQCFCFSTYILDNVLFIQETID
jgi:hypothetical protein